MASQLQQSSIKDFSCGNNPGDLFKQEDNKIRIEDRAVHDWYRFVLSFPPHLVRDYIKKFGIQPGDMVLDPFCGTGTTLVECKKLNIHSIGTESNPMACFASRVKVDWTIDPDSLLNHAKHIAEVAFERLTIDGIEDQYLPLFSSEKKHCTTLRILSEESQKLILKNSISSLPLHKALLLLDTIHEHRDNQFTDHERLAFAKMLVFGASNLHFGPEVGVGRIKKDAPVVTIWLDNVRTIAEDLRTLHGIKKANVIVHQRDSRNFSQSLKANSVHAVITSPPYPNEKDYTRTTRLESVLLGFIQSKEDLRSIKHGLLCSNTRNVYKHDTDDFIVSQHKEIQRIADKIENRRIELGKTSGFERLYARVTRLYFGGMTRHLSDLRAVLRPGAQLAYVVGDQASYLQVLIRTGQLLADIAHSLGYEVVGIDLFRTRLATATKKQLREEIVLLRWPGEK
ncbi:MAG: DNA methyltransferase [Thermodesulfobacteriota bacterium]